MISICEFAPKTAGFYMLPKIHKPTRPPPGCPIISANGCLTEQISEFFDFFLNLLVPKIKSYIKDTTDFARMIWNKAPVQDNTLLVTLDVTSLYTNIPNQKGTKACTKALLEALSRHEVPGI